MLRVVCVKQNTAYEMRISDWSSDVCSSDLADRPSIEQWPAVGGMQKTGRRRLARAFGVRVDRHAPTIVADGEAVADEIGRASWRASVCQYVSILGAAVSLKNKTTQSLPLRYTSQSVYCTLLIKH